MQSLNLESKEIDQLVVRGWKTRVAPAPVSVWAIRAWCAAVGIDDKRFIGVGGDTRGVVAPPPMLQCWAGSGLLHGEGKDATLHSEVRAAFRHLGFRSVVATDYEQDYLADLRPGDIVHEASRISDISECKQTRLGRGHFVLIEFRFATAAQVEVGRLRVRTFYFDPKTARPAASLTVPAAGESENAEAIAITTTLVIAGSIASNDFEAVHHDPAVAHLDGLSDIILSIITTAGLITRYALARVGSDAVMRHLQLRLGSPGMPGDTLHLAGSWSNEETQALAITGDVSRGRHVTARIDFDRPSSR
ncbi:MAG: protein dehydratase [Sphingomonadales bacterium]|nr:protein dehydratase [Sphingomonadales bacterium]